MTFVVRAAHDGGASAFTVVTGHEGDAVEAFLATAAARLALPIAPPASRVMKPVSTCARASR